MKNFKMKTASAPLNSKRSVIEMKLVETTADMKAWSRKQRNSGKSIGFVPTMGYFHKGHLALMKRAKESADVVVVSIFVNPTQFGPNEDFNQYPRDIERDERLARDAGIDCLFFPDETMMYPEVYSTWVEVKGLSEGLCGVKRPGHFRGVATVVLKLFNIVRPHMTVFGQKDFQQLRVIEQMVRDLDLSVEVVRHEIVREPDGLAMSSRNSYLSQEERKEAICLFEALNLARTLYESGTRDAGKLKIEMKRHIERHQRASIDYIFIGDANTLKGQDKVGPGTLVALAVWIGSTRLIDNMLLS